MQVHDRLQGAPVLALVGDAGVCKTHAKPCILCMHGFLHKNGGIFVDF